MMLYSRFFFYDIPDSRELSRGQLEGTEMESETFKGWPEG